MQRMKLNSDVKSKPNNERKKRIEFVKNKDSNELRFFNKRRSRRKKKRSD